MSEKYSVSVDFDNLEVAKKACELMSITFPMLTFNLSIIPDVSVDLSLNTSNFLTLKHLECQTCKYYKTDVLIGPCSKCENFNIYIKGSYYEKIDSQN